MSFERFEDLDINKDLLRGLFGMNFQTPSEIQKKSIIPMLKGRDLIAQAQSGTGKTCCFSIGILNRIEIELLEPQAIVMAPTRELAIQIQEVFSTMGDHLAVKVLLLIGGTPVEGDRKSLTNGCHVIVGTPGRIWDCMKRR